MCRLALIGLTLALLMAVSARPTSAVAHPLLLQATPSSDALLPTPPLHVQLLFSEDVNGPASSILVQNRDHRPVTAGPAFLAPGNPRSLAVRLRHLNTGTYLVFWTAVSAEDGHVVRGSYLFSVRKRDASVRLPSPSHAVGGVHLPDISTLLSILTHWLGLVAVTLWIGAVSFAVLITSAQSIDPAFRRTEATRRHAAVRLGLLVVIVTNIAELALDAHSVAGDWHNLTGSTLSTIFADQYGHLWIVRQVIALLALATTFLWPSTARDEGVASSGPGTASHSFSILAAALGFLYLYALAGSGHAASAGVGALAGSHVFSAAVLIDWLHLVAVTVWLGGQFYIMLVLAPLVGFPTGCSPWTRAFLASLDRFSPVAYVSIGILVLTGAFNGAIHIPSWQAFLASVYGRALIVKLALTGLMLLTSAYTVWRLRPRIREASDEPDSDVDLFGSRMSGLIAWLRVSPILGAGVLLAVSVMFYYPVPESFSRQSLVAGQSWRQIGLSGILIHALAVGHTHPKLVFAAAHGGIYRREANGAWRHVLPRGEIWSLQLLAGDKTVIAGEDDGYVDVSTDMGGHWRRALVSKRGVFAVSHRPGHPAWMLAGAGGGIYVSRDGGRHWRRTLRLPGSAAAALAWQPGSSRTIFAGAIAGTRGGSTQVLWSRNAGLSWRGFGRRLHSLAGIMSLSAPSRTHVFAGTMGNAVWQAPLHSGTWRKTATRMPPKNDHVASIASVRGEPRILFAGTLGDGVFRTTDAGLSWMQVSRGLSPSRNATIVLSLVYDPSSRTVLAGTADGVYELANAVTAGRSS